MSPQAFIFIGRSGSGKGTQAKLLIDFLKKHDPSAGVIYIQTGQELRNLITEPNFTGHQAKGIIERGALMPEFMPIYFWANILKNSFTGKEHVVFDGTPRKPLEAQIMDSVFPFYGLGKPWVLYLNVDHDESAKRLGLRHRSDDDRKTIEKRLEWYETEVVPTVAHYRANPACAFLEIDGNRPIDVIHADIVKMLGFK